MPDLALVRQWRIKNLEKGLEKAEQEGNRNKIFYFKKEIEIQKAYLFIEGL